MLRGLRGLGLFFPGAEEPQAKCSFLTSQSGLCWGYIGIMEKKMETTISYRGYMDYIGNLQVVHLLLTERCLGLSKVVWDSEIGGNG